MTFANKMNGGVDQTNDEVSKLLNTANGINRFYSPYQPQNPYEPYDEPHPQHYAFHPNYESEYLPHGYGSGRFGAPTFHHNIYSTLGHGDVHRHSHHGSKNSSVAMSALTLLAFLFFINMLQSCLKDQMLSMNPTVMVMTAGSGRLKKTGTSSVVFDSKQEENGGEAGIASPIADKIEFLTNDQGDIFYQPRKELGNKYSDSLNHPSQEINNNG